MGIYAMLCSRKERNKFNTEQQKRKIFSENIKKRLIATLSQTKLNYMCQGTMNPTIYTRYGCGGMFLLSISNIWEFDFDEIVCRNGNVKQNNDRATIRVLFEGGDSWNGGLIEITPENIVYAQDFAAVEHFFQNIKRYINKNE